VIAACGTCSGYVRHINNKEAACMECRTAKAVYSRAYRHAKNPEMKYHASKYDPVEHGTEKAYLREKRHGAPCPECEEAHVARVRSLLPCGTAAAYKRHRNSGEEACAACKRAHTDARTARNHAKNPDMKYYLPRNIGGAPCGTSAAYQRHWRRKETPCEVCQEGNRVRMREKYHAKKKLREGAA
jgi:hypothetical protein